MSSRSTTVVEPWHIMLGSGIYLCCNLFSPRGTPLLLGGDEQVFWMNALRMLQGELIYRDFFEFTPPGTDLVYASAFALFGARIWVPNLVLLLLGISLAWLCFQIARRVLTTSAAALVTVLFLVLDFGKWLDATHHWFSLLAVLAAVLVLLEGSSVARVLVAGALFGVASFFTQTRGVAAALGLAGFLLWERMQTQASWGSCWVRLFSLLLSSIATWALLGSYFILKLGLPTLFHFQAVYVLEYVTHQAHNPFPWDNDPLAWPIRYQLVYVAVPLIYALALWKCRPTAVTASIARRPVILLAAIGAGLYLEVAQSPNWLRLDSTLLPALILVGWLLRGWLERLPLAARWPRYATPILWIGLIGLGAYEARARNVDRPVILDLPAGRAAVPRAKGEKLAWLARHTTPGEPFFEASYQSTYLPLGLRNPTFDYLDRYTSPEFVALDLRQLAAQPVRYILWSPLDRPRYPQFEQFLSEHYGPVRRFPDGDEIWELKRGQ